MINYLNCQFAKLAKRITCLTRFQSTTAYILDSELENAKSYDEIPREKSFPFIGTRWLYFPIIGKYDSTKRHEAILQQYLKYGKIVREDISPTFNILHIFDAQDMEKMRRYEGRNPKRLTFESIKFYREQKKELYTNFGLSVEQESRWRELRSKVQRHMLRPALIHDYLPAMDTTARELVDRIGYSVDNNGEVPELMNELYKWALESITSVAFNTRLGCLSKDITTDSETWKLIEAVNNIFAVMLQLEFSPLKLWRFFPFPTITKFIKCMDIVSDVATKYLQEAIVKLEQSSFESGHITFLENLLITEKMDMDHVNVVMTDMVLSGIDTTSYATGFVLYILAKNQDCQQKLHEELCRVLPDISSPITISVLNECRYLKAAVKESMRLSPIVTGNMRILDRDIVLSGYRIPAGVAITSENQIACMLEENFSEPTKFIPERWIRGVNTNKFNPFVFSPFGFGPRGCIGKRIAEQKMWTSIIQKYRLEYHYEDIGIYTKLVNVPDKPLRLRFIER